MSSPRRRFAEFFSGIGLVRMGLEQAGWNCVFANDHDPKKRSYKITNYIFFDQIMLIHHNVA